MSNDQFDVKAAELLPCINPIHCGVRSVHWESCPTYKIAAVATALREAAAEARAQAFEEAAALGDQRVADGGSSISALCVTLRNRAKEVKRDE